jgi:uncharacterized phage-like protein YoqJ
MENSNYIIAFTGHRSYDNSADDKLRETITSLHNIGARHFRVGMAEGFDMAAAEMVMELMSEDNSITLEAFIPWPEFEKHLSDRDTQRYHKILSCCTEQHFASEEYNKGVFHKRNDMLIAGCDYLIAWWDGSSSGTGYTVKQARKDRIKIINLYPSPQMKLQL